MDKKLLQGYTRLYAEYRYEARRKDREFALTIKEFMEITSKECAYCGSLPVARKPQFTQGGWRVYPPVNGIDRIDNAVGYLPTNVRTACKACNSMKSSRDLKEFLLLVKNIYEKHKEYFKKKAT
jgi:hypothetical protein